MRHIIILLSLVLLVTGTGCDNSNNEFVATSGAAGAPGSSTTQAGFTLAQTEPPRDLEGATVQSFLAGSPLRFNAQASNSRVSNQGANGVRVVVRNIRGEIVAETTTDGQGFFRLLDLPSGYHTVEVFTGSATEPTLTEPVSLFPTHVYILGGPPPTVSREEATAKALTAVTDDFRVLGSLTPLPAGTTVNPQRNPDGSEPTSEQVLQLSSSQWFFMLDPKPGVRFGHSVIYLFVDSETGEISRFEEAQWPPIINSGAWWANDVDFLSFIGIDPSDVASITSQSQFEVVPSAEVVSLSVAEPDSIQSRSQEQREVMARARNTTPDSMFALLVRGDEDTTMAFDLVTMRDILILNGLPPGNMEVVDLSTSRTFEDALAKYDAAFERIQDKIEARLANDEQSTFILYVTSHGQGTAFQLGVTEVDYKGSFQFNRTRIESLRACRIRILAEFCFAQEFFEVFLKHVADFPVDNANIPRDIVIVTATNRVQECASNPIVRGLVLGILSFGEAKVGGKFTNIVAEMIGLADGDITGLWSSNFQLLGELAESVTTFSILAQEGVLNRQDAQILFTQGESPWCQEVVEPSELSLEHDANNDPCPNTVGTFVIRNRQLFSADWTATPELSALQVTPNQGTLRGGQEVTVTVTYDCSESESFTAGIDVELNSIDAQEEGRVEVAVDLGEPSAPGRISYCPGDSVPVRESTIVDGQDVLLFDRSVNFFGSSNQFQLPNTCPERFGSFSVTWNRFRSDPSPVSLRITGPPNLPLEFQPCQFQLTPGTSQQVEVFYTCQPEQPLGNSNEAITVEALGPAPDNEVQLQQVRVNWSIVREAPI